jgi:hypothetical protein
LRIEPGLCPGADASTSPDGRFFFDDTTVTAWGQSLGSPAAVLFGAVEPGVKIVMPTGSGALLAKFALESEEFPGSLMVRVGMGLPKWEEPDIFHPFFLLAQLLIAPAEPAHYNQRLILRPLPGNESKHVYYTNGIYDDYFPPQFGPIMGISMDLDMVGETIDPHLPEGLALLGRTPLDYPLLGVSGNRLSEGGVAVTGTAVQFLEDGIKDGHYVVFQLEEAKYQYGCFLETYQREGMPRLVDPLDENGSPHEADDACP